MKHLLLSIFFFIFCTRIFGQKIPEFNLKVGDAYTVDTVTKKVEVFEGDVLLLFDYEFVSIWERTSDTKVDIVANGYYSENKTHIIYKSKSGAVLIYNIAGKSVTFKTNLERDFVFKNCQYQAVRK